MHAIDGNFFSTFGLKTLKVEGVLKKGSWGMGEEEERSFKLFRNKGAETGQLLEVLL